MDTEEKNHELTHLDTFKTCLRDLNGISQKTVSIFESALKVLAYPSDVKVYDSSFYGTRHHILLIDRRDLSSSARQELLLFTRKLLTIEEYRDPKTRVSVISFDRRGIYHQLNNALVTEVLNQDLLSIFLEQRLSDLVMRVAIKDEDPLTLAIRMVKEIESENEWSVITLHTKSFFEDEIPSVDLARRLELSRVGKEHKISINCLYYHSVELPILLKKIALLGGGIALRASSLKLVYDKLFSSIEAQAQRSHLLPLRQLTKGEGWLLINYTTQRILCGSDRDKIQGVSAEDHHLIYTFRSHTLSQKTTTFNSSEVSSLNESSTLIHRRALIALSYYYLTVERRLNLAKYALMESQDQELCTHHLRALTEDELLAMRDSLEGALLSQSPQSVQKFIPKQVVRERSFGKNGTSNTLPVPQLLRLLVQYRDHIKISRDHLYENYRYIGLAEVKGVRNERGELSPPKYMDQPRDPQHDLGLHHVSLTRHGANLIMTTSERVKLHNNRGELINEVEGVSLENLSILRSFAIIADGQLNVPTLKLKIKHRLLFNDLKARGLIFGRYRPLQWIEIALHRLPLAEPPKINLQGNLLIKEIVKLKFISSYLKGYLGMFSTRYTAQQLKALHAHGISSELIFNHPMNSAHPHLSEAQEAGKLGKSNRIRIELGSDHLGLVSRTPNALTLIKSCYRIETEDKVYKIKDLVEDVSLSAIAKKLFQSTLDQDSPQERDSKLCQLRLAKGLKKTPLRELLIPLCEELMGFSEPKELRILLQKYGLEYDLPSLECVRLSSIAAESSHSGSSTPREDGRYAIKRLYREIELRLLSLYQEEVSPSIYFIGTTGLFPPQWDHHDGFKFQGRGRTEHQDDSSQSMRWPLEHFARDHSAALTYSIGHQVFLRVTKKERRYTIDKQTA